MKTTKVTSMIQLLMISLCTLTSAHALAAPPVLTELSTTLQEERMKAESANAQTQETLTEIEAKKAALEIQKREIEEANAKTLTSVKKEVTPEMLEAVMLLDIPNCKVVKESLNADGRQDYTITNVDVDGNKASIRFYFNTSRTLLAPYAKPFKAYDGIHYVEIKQPRYNPKEPTKDGFMEGTVIFTPVENAAGKQKYQVSHAVFTGERRFDIGITPFLWDSSKPFTINCIIGN